MLKGLGELEDVDAGDEAGVEGWREVFGGRERYGDEEMRGVVGEGGLVFGRGFGNLSEYG